MRQDVTLEARILRNHSATGMLANPSNLKRLPPSFIRIFDSSIVVSALIQEPTCRIMPVRMIHRTNNYYCYHYDLQSSPSNCFGSNVEPVPLDQRVEVKWDDESALKPQLICGKQALQRLTSWKYLINLVGQDFLLRNNLELIAALKAQNGSNLIESFSINKYKHWAGNSFLLLYSTPALMGSIYGAYLREFPAKAMLGSDVETIRKVMLQHKAFDHQDELFFPTLAYNSHAKLLGSCLIALTPSSEARFKNLRKCVIWFYAGFHPETYGEMGRLYFAEVQIEWSTGSHSKHHFDPAIYATLS
uniref:Hexosyltransferase n=1 Tax=Taenia asiatica TaxID=60517 RepID=A0A0R3WGX2_TAEAS